MLINIEEQRIWRGFLRSHLHKREFEEIASMQDTSRTKRQYRGGMMQGHYFDFFESRRKAELSSNATLVEAGQHFGELCAGIRGIEDRDTWRLQNVDYSTTGFQDMASSSSIFTSPQFQSAMEPSHSFSSDSMVKFTNGPLTRNDGSSRSRKRKFLFDGATRSVRLFKYEASSGQSNGTRLTRRLGARDTVLGSTSSFPACDGSLYSRYNDGIIQPLNAEPLYCPQKEMFNGYGTRHLCQSHPIRQSKETSSTLPFLMWRSRRMLENECLPESAASVNVGLLDNSSTSQSSGTSSAATWFGSRTFHGENMHPRFSYSGFTVGTRAKRHHSSERTHWLGTPHANCRMQNSFEPLSRSMFRTGRHLPLRESAPGGSQIVSPEAFAASSSLIYEPEEALGGMNSSFVPVHGVRIPSFFSEGERGRLSARPTQSRMPRRRRRRRVNRQQPHSHELSNQALEHDEVDIDDQYSNMRLDVDNMSYEELLVLGERIGTVKTGLSADSIQKCLKMIKHSAASVFCPAASHKTGILCSICQEEYRENDVLCQLVCGHSYHPACIKQWLGLKNQCPICKAVADSEC